MKTFNIYPNIVTNKRYIKVEIYPTHSKLLKAINKEGGREIGPPNLSIECCCIWLVPKPRLRKVGVMLFSQEGLTPGNIAHEIDHAATYWTAAYEVTRRRKIHTNEYANEQRAQLVDRLTRQVYDQL